MHVFEVVAEPIRRRLVEVLASGSHYLGDLEDVIRHEFGVSRAAVHHHLKVLRAHGAVLQHDDWPRSLYELDSAILEQLASELDQSRQAQAAVQMHVKIGLGKAREEFRGEGT